MNVQRSLSTSPDTITPLANAPAQKPVSEESRYSALIDASPGIVWRSSPDLSVLETWGWSEATGQANREAAGQGWFDIVHPEDRDLVVALLEDGRRRGQPFEGTYRARHIDGQYRWVHARVVPLRDDSGAIREWVGNLLDVHDKVEADAALQTAEERLRLALEGSAVGVWDYDFHAEKGWWSEAKRKVLGLPEDYPITQESFLALVHPNDRPEVEAHIARAMNPECGRFDAEFRVQRYGDGTEVWLASCGQVIFDHAGEPSRILGTMRDITAQREAQQALYKLAHFDQLTGLANRSYFSARLEAALPNLRNGAVILLDLDGFKNVNDTAGHHAGDLLLRAAAKRLEGLLPPGAIAARWGGDEFAVFVPDEHRADHITGLLRAVEVSFNEPFTLLQRQVFLSISMGVAHSTNNVSGDELLLQADLALYRAKADGRGLSRTFSPALKQEAQSRIDLETDLRRAFTCSEFEMHYQPQVKMVGHAIVGAEALLRWRHPDKGLLSPAAFLPVLESSPIARAVGDWTLSAACAFASRCLTAGRPIRIGVNLFSAQILLGGLLGTVKKCLHKYCLPPSLLELEITEHTILKGDAGTIETLAELRKLGVGIAFDYGTGYASLSMLAEYPLTRLKIDRKFVKGIVRLGDEAVVKAVVSLGHAFGMEVTAEGIETDEQSRLVGELGCDEGQGYLYGRPAPEREMFSRLGSAAPTAAWSLTRASAGS